MVVVLVVAAVAVAAAAVAAVVVEVLRMKHKQKHNKLRALRSTFTTLLRGSEHSSANTAMYQASRDQASSQPRPSQ